MNDIWFRLCIGNIETDDSGLTVYDAAKWKDVRLTVFDASTISEGHREELHNQLDKAIDELNATPNNP